MGSLEAQFLLTVRNSLHLFVNSYMKKTKLVVGIPGVWKNKGEVERYLSINSEYNEDNTLFNPYGMYLLTKIE